MFTQAGFSFIIGKLRGGGGGYQPVWFSDHATLIIYCFIHGLNDLIDSIYNKTVKKDN